MEKISFTNPIKQKLLVVSASALMLGAAQAGTTVGLNFQTWNYDSGNTPQTVGYGNNYSTTGFPVTARAFGVDTNNWFNTDPMSSAGFYGYATFNVTTTTFGFGAGLQAFVEAGLPWQSGIGGVPQAAVPPNGYTPEIPPPGNDEVTWGFLYGAQVTLSGLAEEFANGYVVGSIAANSGVQTFDPVNFVDVPDGANPTTGSYTTYQVTGPGSIPVGTVGVSGPSGVYTNDQIEIYGGGNAGSDAGNFAGFIITDQPVIDLDPVGGTRLQGNSFSLTPNVLALTNGLAYQWRTNGVSIPGATNSTYVILSPTAADAGNYDVVVTNLYGSATSAVATVTFQALPQNAWTASANNVTADADVLTSGTNVFAYDWNSSATTVNGVSFTAPGSGVTLSAGLNSQYNGYGNSGLSLEYYDITTGGEYGGDVAGTVTLNGLTIGEQYLVQLWVVDARGGSGPYRNETVSSGGMVNTATLNYYGNGSGQYTYGTFIATGTQQVITLTPDTSLQINALQLRDLGLYPVATTPTFNPPAGSYIGAQTVAISGLGTIFYTTNGTTPTSSSAVYTAPISVPVGTTMTIEAFATNTGVANSSVASATYTTFATPAVPTWIDAAGGSWATTANWSNTVVANGIGVTADISRLTLSGNATITLDSTPTVGQILFADQGNAFGWTLGSGAGGPLTLASSNTPVIAVSNQTVAISAIVAGTNGLIKAGAGNLTLSGASTFTGTATVNAGTLQVQSKSGDIPYVVTNGATLQIGYSTGGGYANTAMQIYGAGAAATTGFYLAGGANYDCNGQIQLLGGPTTLRQYGTGLASIGIYDVNSIGIWCSAAASGSALDPNIQLVSDGYGMTVQVDAGANTATGDLAANGPLNVNGYGLIKSGAGSLRLNGTAAPSNLALQVSGGAVICGATNCIGANASLLISSGATLNLNGFSQTVAATTSGYAGSTTLAGGLQMTINKGGSPNSDVLTVTGANPLTFGGTLTVTNVGGALAVGDTFALFSATSFANNFTATNLPALGVGLGWNWDPTSGVLSVVANGSSITSSLSGSTLTLTWPAGQGWILLAQTNTLSTGLGTSWTPVTGTGVGDGSAVITIDATKPTVFYKLVNP